MASHSSPRDALDAALLLGDHRTATRIINTHPDPQALVTDLLATGSNPRLVVAALTSDEAATCTPEQIGAAACALIGHLDRPAIQLLWQHLQWRPGPDTLLAATWDQLTEALSNMQVEAWVSGNVPRRHQRDFEDLASTWPRTIGQLLAALDHLENPAQVRSYLAEQS